MEWWLQNLNWKSEILISGLLFNRSFLNNLEMAGNFNDKKLSVLLASPAFLTQFFFAFLLFWNTLEQIVKWNKQLT